MNTDHVATRALLLRRQGMLFFSADDPPLEERYLQAVDLELAALGYQPSHQLREALRGLPLGALAETSRWTCEVLAAKRGADVAHVPLFRKFPKGIPRDTYDLWWRKVISHFLQAPGQPCLFCCGEGTTHVLAPCCHVVCDRCFDGASYSACPVCEQPVDRDSPFFGALPEAGQPQERVTFELLRLGGDLETAAYELFESFCARTQPMSPDDRDDLRAMIADYPAWGGLLPESIPVRENAAIVIGSLLRHRPAEEVLELAHPHIKTATDVLRVIAEFSGADPALQGEVILKEFERTIEPGRWWGPLAKLLEEILPRYVAYPYSQPMTVRRFKVARMSRALRRALLGLLERQPPDQLVEDMLRHRAYWVWVGQFLHPHEYARRFPAVARAFKILRKKGPDGTPAPPFLGFHGRLESARQAGDGPAARTLLSSLPGELARRLDHLLRLSGEDAAAAGQALAAFVEATPELATPVLLTLRSVLPRRLRPAASRVFWPKGGTAGGVLAPDTRPPLPGDLVWPATAAAEAELLRRFGEQPPVEDWIIDRGLDRVIAPFNERTASRAAIDLPRGSAVDLPDGKLLRLFLHWCEPAGAHTTDLDLSVGFYDAMWQYAGVCSYYELTFRDIATSAGDLQGAPPPDGASEFIDVRLEMARGAGLRYAVMVVAAYAGLPFSRLERAFAGVMLRDDPEGQHFDPRTVALRFALTGERGVFLPLVVDLVENRLHWLDLYARGEWQFNNVTTANRDITRVCPAMIDYFASGERTSLYQLSLLHAAARAQRVILRGAEGLVGFERRPGEPAHELLRRLQIEEEGVPLAELPGDPGRNRFATLLRGDLELPEDTPRYVLFGERIAGNVAASDLIV